MTLSSAGVQRAKAAIAELARPLDRARFAAHFDGGSAEDVLAELARYQNDDGGFGNALEPDFRLEASSPMATSVGLEYALDADAPATHPIVEGALEYLQRTYDRQRGYWPATFADVTDAPHAPWWHLEEPTRPTEAAWPNPSAELVGYCWAYRSGVPDEFLETVTERARENVRETALVGDDLGRRYAVLCWERALPHLPDDLAESVRAALERTVETMTPLSESLAELPAFVFAYSPETTVARVHPGAVDERLNAEVDAQAADGAWWPDWEWGQYEGVWPTAEREWAGKLTLECLETLERFGKLESR